MVLDFIDTYLGTHQFRNGQNEIRRYYKRLEKLYNDTQLFDKYVVWVDNHFYRVNVYFRDTTVTVYSQDPSMTEIDFWASAGGVLGLWVGISIFTAAEVLCLIVDIFRICCSKNKKGESTS